MPATTIKTVNPLFMLEAAEAYSKFLLENPSEQEWLKEWEKADLANLPDEALGPYLSDI